MSLRVIGAGVGRTGTHSLKLALERLLGEPCYHMYELNQNAGHTKLWLDAAQGKPVDWEAMFADYSAAVDWPASAYWEELSRAFPDAVIVLSVREAEKWHASGCATIFHRVVDGDPSPERQQWLEMMRLMLEKTFTFDLLNKDAAIEAFEKHNAYVREHAPRLVIWQASDGWAPLCAALGMPIPEEPFPRSNSAEEFADRVSKLAPGESMHAPK